MLEFCKGAVPLREVVPGSRSCWHIETRGIPVSIPSVSGPVVIGVHDRVDHERRLGAQARRARRVEHLEPPADEPETGGARDVEVVLDHLAARRALSWLEARS